LGRQTFSDGSYYEGNWHNDQANGYGIFIQIDGGKYEGQFINGSCSGQGKFTSGNGQYIYEG